MTTATNLPAEVSSFVGREQQLAELRRLLHRFRLVTLTGPGGAGKTRLAERLAGELLDRYQDGVWLVELPAVTDARLLEQTVAFTCGIKEQRGRPTIDVLLKTLASSHVLLILDGCEHLVDACATFVSRIQRACPKLAVLVTSREPLGLAGEVVWRVPSLTLPPATDSLRPELLLQSEAVRLFVDRARLNRPDLELDGAASPAVAQICARLEGIPLAIELAAGLARVLTFEDILARLHDRFRLLTGGSRTALPRHQTLRAAVDWSYGLLSAEEKELLARLSVFGGGFSLAAAEAVASGDPIDTRAVLPLLSRLVDKSLVVAEPGWAQGTRYRMLDTIREYALDKLHQAGEAEMRRRHSRYFIEWCTQSQNELRGRHQLDWLQHLEEDQGNIRLALEWCLVEQPEDALRMVAGLYRYWAISGHLVEALDWLDRVLGTSPAPSENKAAALLARSYIRYMHGDYGPARADAQGAIDLCRAIGPSPTLFVALTLSGILMTGAGDWVGAGRLHDEAFQLAWQLRDPWWVASSLNNLGIIAMERGDHEVARSRLEQALTGFRQAGDRLSTAHSLDSLARVNLKLEDHAAARSNFLEALTMELTFADTTNAAISLEGLAEVEVTDGRPERAVELVAAAQSLRKPIGVELGPEWRVAVDKTLEDARAKLSNVDFEMAWKRGTTLSLGEAVGYANGAAAPSNHDGDSPLTGRETQVALLIAEGLTNPEIAARLRMAERTADAHVEHIRNKLGLRSRAQIAVWAHERLGSS